MNKQHYIKTVADIKYCEDNEKTVFSEFEKNRYYEFHNNVWCQYKKGSRDIIVYNCEMFVDDLELYYYEKESEELQEATEKDVGKLCWFSNVADGDKYISILSQITSDNIFVSNIFASQGNWQYWKHCRPLTKAEIQEFMEKVE